mmetsp:Transcript_51534/g.103560  ORF Transcript_51534/g.103560 Transcript_51534/m.103560 type:complete len:337 (-) Transcript_51534:80-1090(-)
MGREDVFPSTGFVPARACWLCYALVAFVFAGTVALPQHSDPWHNGLIASLESTVVVFVFALTYRNTSIYDPFWCWYPLFAAVSWMASASSAPSWRGWYTLALIAGWIVRYNISWTWEGWFHGIRTEDWRYVMMARRLGLTDSVGVSYWLVVSLIGSHVVPTMLVWFVLGPVEKVWTMASEGPAFGALDVIAIAVSIGGVALQFASDRTLRTFRQRNVASTPGQSIETQVCGQPCREGPWAYSRHPNYLGEVLFWLGMDLAALAGGMHSWPWTCVGILSYAGFFRVSSSLMDKRSLANRPGYAQVMEEVNALFPCPLALDRAVDCMLIGSPKRDKAT